MWIVFVAFKDRHSLPVQGLGGRGYFVGTALTAHARTNNTTSLGPRSRVAGGTTAHTSDLAFRRAYITADDLKTSLERATLAVKV